MHKYKVRVPCEVLGVFRHADEVFALNDEQARLLKPPFGNVIVPVLDDKSQAVSEAENSLDADDNSASKKEPANGKLKRG